MKDNTTANEFALNRIKSKINSGNDSYRSVRNLSSIRLLSTRRNEKIKKNIILPVALYGCEAWSHVLKEEQKVGLQEKDVEMTWVRKEGR
jgi:hypothetical protein